MVGRVSAALGLIVLVAGETDISPTATESTFKL